MNTHKLKPNDYSYGIKLPNTKISVCILCRIESIYNTTSGSAMAEGPRDALVSRNSATTKYPYHMALFA